MTEGSAGTFDRTEVGNDDSGGYSLYETSDTSYSMTETLTGSEVWTLSETGDDSMTASESGDRITGGYTRTENGTDGYTLTESGVLTGGAFSQTVTGTDGYTTTWNGNHAKGTYDQETIGGGTWTRTSGGPGATLTSGSGTNDYTQSATGDEIAGHFSASETGADRYGLIDRFADVSNTDPGTDTPGNVTFHTHGRAFRDPGLEVEEFKKRLDELTKRILAIEKNLKSRRNWAASRTDNMTKAKTLCQAVNGNRAFNTIPRRSPPDRIACSPRHLAHPTPRGRMAS